MDVKFRNAEGNLSQMDKEYAAQKLGKLDRYFHGAKKIELVHREDRLHHHHIEITVFADGFTLRGEQEQETVRAAIDTVFDKLENRLSRLKTRLVKSQRRRGLAMPTGFEEPQEDDEEQHVEIRERKHFLLKHMAYDEAALQMELLDHPFIVFRNEESGNLEVMYKRKDGKFGLMQPEG